MSYFTQRSMTYSKIERSDGRCFGQQQLLADSIETFIPHIIVADLTKEDTDHSFTGSSGGAPPPPPTHTHCPCQRFGHYTYRLLCLSVLVFALNLCSSLHFTHAHHFLFLDAEYMALFRQCMGAPLISCCIASSVCILFFISRLLKGPQSCTDFTTETYQFHDQDLQ